MTNHEVGIKLGKLTREERQKSHEILETINIALAQRSYVELGFSSMFDWLVNGFGYSKASAYERIEAAKLLKIVPEISRKLEAGTLNLSTVAKAQSLFKASEKKFKKEISSVEKAQVIKQIETKSVKATEQIMVSLYPELASEVRREFRVTIDENTTRHSMNLSNEVVDDLQRAKELLSHKFPNASDAEIIGYALRFLIAKTDPLKKSGSADEPTPLSKARHRRKVLQQSEGRRTYVDPISGRACDSRYQVQIDHVTPKALGGADKLENFRPLCRQHNLLVAEQVFGKVHMDKFRTLQN